MNVTEPEKGECQKQHALIAEYGDLDLNTNISTKQRRLFKNLWNAVSHQNWSQN